MNEGKYDLLLKGGVVIDPSQGINARRDVAVAGGKVATINDDIPAARAAMVLNVSGKVVTPGLIDAHGHFYNSFLPWGIDPDEICLPNGATTAVDGGSSGWANFAGFKTVCERSRTRLYALLHISPIGLFYLFHRPELSEVSLIDPVRTAECIQEHRDLILGVKIRVASDAIANGQALVALQKAVDAAERARCPVTAHISRCPVPLAQVLERLRPGDTVTHIYNDSQHNALDGNGTVRREVVEADRRGLFFDVSSGRVHLSFDVAQKAMAQGLLAHVMSTDVTVPGAASGVSLLNLMSTFLALGMSLEDVVRCNTANAAALMGKSGELGTLRPGAAADIAVLRIEEGDYTFTDFQGKTLKGTKRLGAEMTLREGVVVFPKPQAK